MRRAAAAAVGIAIVACGCGHHNHAAPGGAAAIYLQAAAEANREVAVARATMNVRPTDLQHLRDGLLGIARAKEGLDRAIRTITAPPRTAGDIARLLTADLALETDLHRAANATSVAEVMADETQVLVSGQAAFDAAGRVRADLGLPPVP